MGQAEVLDILRKSRTGLTSKEIHARLQRQGHKISVGTVTNNLRKLRRRGNGSSQVVRYYKASSLHIPFYIIREQAPENILKRIEKYPDWVNDI